MLHGGDQKESPSATVAVSNGVRSGASRLPLDKSALTKRTSLRLAPGMTLDAWRRLGRQIFVIADSSGWWLGDWLVYGETHYPDRYKRALSETSLDYQTLRNYAWIARKFSPGRRREKLSMQHHAEVAGLAETQQDYWLNQAERFGWSRNELRRRIRTGRLNGPANDELSYVRLNIVAERKHYWQEAAQSANQDLPEWIVSILDQAAVTTLATRS